MKLKRLAAYVSALTLAGAAALTGASAASADQAAADGYVALGDSYSSGVGAGDYDSSGCKRSANAYPQLWANAHSPSSFDFTACSGAVTGDVLANQLGPLSASTGTVTISIGGNDAGFSDVMINCVLPGEDNCISRINTARSFVENELPAKLDQVYDQISSRAPNAHVVVLGYPRFYKIDGSCVAGLTDEERSAVNGASDLLNQVTSARASAHGFSFASVVGNFTGHEICSGDAWLHSVSLPDVTNSYHPTAAGQSGGYLPALESAS
ncbi:MULTISPECIES: SGNH/GDSL hydrolase family protein [Streptomyces]|uniref:triacylglycerol lipase n=1 Tax=Streptomyces albus (strain ATCC 21838 / DSM 41398 / FERM P-419 / JCM 4703 / NBRC 107858) TaxID=1081613 RepID=A0A0B5EUK9_STRA4|nr:SGNH/GDSL hydrolase family protein [Streptomyces sp. SCSIO ZS0520]AJE86533.1 putative secreted hydrolase [Streptomyces albus]AOU80837.1 putative secreted hydrolase [Streptomyces albus]AYN36540.1 SGNH/GDSL hydrolase family protein [Streptomyces albus]